MKTDPKQIYRFHIALQTNDDAKLFSWNLRGEKIEIHMKV